MTHFLSPSLFLPAPRQRSASSSVSTRSSQTPTDICIEEKHIAAYYLTKHFKQKQSMAGYNVSHSTAPLVFNVTLMAVIDQDLFHSIWSTTPRNIISGLRFVLYIPFHSCA
jgi:hypothetical protein